MEDDLVAVVINTAFKIYFSQGRLPILFVVMQTTSLFISEILIHENLHYIKLRSY